MIGILLFGTAFADAYQDCAADHPIPAQGSPSIKQSQCLARAQCVAETKREECEEKARGGEPTTATSSPSRVGGLAGMQCFNAHQDRLVRLQAQCTYLPTSNPAYTALPDPNTPVSATPGMQFILTEVLYAQPTQAQMQTLLIGEGVDPTEATVWADDLVWLNQQQGISGWPEWTVALYDYAYPSGPALP